MPITLGSEHFELPVAVEFGGSRDSQRGGGEQWPLTGPGLLPPTASYSNAGLGCQVQALTVTGWREVVFTLLASGPAPDGLIQCFCQAFTCSKGRKCSFGPITLLGGNLSLSRGDINIRLSWVTYQWFGLRKKCFFPPQGE